MNIKEFFHLLQYKIKKKIIDQIKKEEEKEIKRLEK